MGWTEHWTGTVGGRSIAVQTYSEGGYRVVTTAGETTATPSYSDGSSHVFGVVTKKGDRLNLDGETIDEVREQLVAEGFDEQQIDEIVGHFPPA